MSNVAINILAEFVGKKAFRDAQRSVGSLEKSVVKLGRGLGLALGTTAIVAYGKASVKAFASDEAAAQRLATAVDNLGLSYSKTKVADFISGLETSAGIADDVLRPAMQALLTTTGSLTKSQVLLNDAITISRASGIDLATVSQDLANGYVGITKGLKKYNTGLTQAELKSKSFSEVLGIILTRSAGAADAYLGTTSYKLSVLSVAADNAKESIGKGLIDAFARVAGGTEASDAAKAINDIAKAVNFLTLGLGIAIGLVNKFRKGYTNFLMDPLGTDKITAQSTNRSASPAGTAKRTAQQRAAEAAAAKRAKELSALLAKQVKAQKALTAEQKKQALLKKASTLFDLDQANLIAALKGNLSEEDRKRAELQLALLTGNIKEVQRLTLEIGTAQGLSKELAGYLASLPDAKNPFAAWEAYLDMIAKKAAQIPTILPNVGGTGAMGNPNFDTMNGYQIAAELDKSTAYILNLAKEADALVAAIASSSASNPAALTALKSININTGAGNYGGLGGAGQAGGGGAPIQVVVQIDGKEIASSNQSQSLSGNPSSVSRLAGMFAG
jgi:hypothetical protein